MKASQDKCYSLSSQREVIKFTFMVSQSLWYYDVMELTSSSKGALKNA